MQYGWRLESEYTVVPRGFTLLADTLLIQTNKEHNVKEPCLSNNSVFLNGSVVRNFTVYSLPVPGYFCVTTADSYTQVKLQQSEQNYYFSPKPMMKGEVGYG